MARTPEVLADWLSSQHSRYTDRFFQMIDGKLARIISDRDEIQELANIAQ